VRDLRTLRRAHSGSRLRSVQGRLSIQFGDEDEVGEYVKTESPTRSSGFRRHVKLSGAGATAHRPSTVKHSNPVFHPLAYRSVIADWPIDWRGQWGQRANELEESGLSWRDAEAQAFVEIWHEFRRSHSDDALAPFSTAPAISE
jgi:hypothetical protein